MAQARTPASPRCAALVGPYLSGKTTLLESLLFASGTITRKGSVRDGNTVGDSAQEAKARQMSVEVAAATTEFLGERWCLLDCPGSIELMTETQNALMAADIAVVVCEPNPDKAWTLAPLFKFLDDQSIPHLLFINKIDTLASSELRVRDILQAFQAVSERPLVLRQVPIREDGQVTGFIDLVSERAWRFNSHAPSSLVPLPGGMLEREREARQEMLEALADYDDRLLEQLLEDTKPDTSEVYQQFTKDLAQDLVVPVLLGSGDADGGVRRLWKALRHDGPEVATTAARLEIGARPGTGGVNGASGAGEAGAGTVVQVFKTYLAAHAGKLSISRIWQGTVTDGMTLGGERVSGVYHMLGQQQTKLAQAGAGEVVALGRMDKAATGDLLTDRGPSTRSPFWPEVQPPVFGLAIQAENRNDEVKLTAAVQKLSDEDPSLCLDHNSDTREIVLWGQGDIHLQVAIDRLRNKYNVAVRSRAPQVPYKETIRKSTRYHSRFKRQTGGHGQFADIHVEIRPLQRGEGFLFSDQIVGGVVPRQFIPAVETGVREWMGSGPLGFPMVDFAVSLVDGQYHSVDSSEMAFKIAARQAMVDACPKCEPVLLEPILLVTIAVPNEFTSRAQRVVTGRRGQLLGYDAKPGWKNWDEIKAYMPQSEIHDLIVELRSLSLGVGTYTWSFDRLAELTGRLADRAVELRKSMLSESS